MNRRAESGFAMLETLIALVLLAGLLGSILVNYPQARETARLNRTFFGLQTLRTAIERYRFDHQGRPPETLERLIEKSDGGPYLSRIPAGDWEYTPESGRLLARGK